MSFTSRLRSLGKKDGKKDSKKSGDGGGGGSSKSLVTPDIPPPVTGTVYRTSMNIEIGDDETQNVPAASIAASAATSSSSSKTVRSGIKGVTPTSKKKVAAIGSSVAQAVGISPKLKKLQTPESSYQEQSSSTMSIPEKKGMSAGTSLTLEKQQLGPVTLADTATPLSVAGTASLTSPNLGIGVSEAHKVVATSIAASTTASLSPSGKVKFGLKGVPPTSKTKVTASGFSAKKALGISPKLKKSKTPELSFQEQSSAVRSFLEMERMSAETPLALEQQQLGLVTPLSVTGTSSLTSPNIRVGVSEIDKVVASSITTSTTASLAPSGTVKFGLKGVAPSSKTKMAASGFSAEQTVGVPLKLKIIQTPELSFQEQSSATRSRPDMEGISAGTSLALEQKQLLPDSSISSASLRVAKATSSSSSPSSQRVHHETSFSEMKGSSIKSERSDLTPEISQMKALSSPELIRTAMNVTSLLRSSTEELNRQNIGVGRAGDSPERPVTFSDTATPLSETGTVSLTSPNLGAGVSKIDKVAATSIASLSPSGTVKFGLKGLSPTSKTKVATSDFSVEQEVAILPKILQTPELSYQEQSSATRSRTEMEGISAGTSLTLEQTQIGQVTSPDVAAPLSLSSLTGPNIGIGISETDKVVGTSIAASTAASLSPSETIKFGLKGVAPSLKTKVVTRGFSDEQGVDISPKLKKLQTPELSFEEQSSGIRLRPDVEALSGETSLTLEQTQLGQVTSPDIAAPLSVAGTVGLTGPNIGIGISETDKVVGTSIAASTAASLSPSETIKFGLKGVAPSLKTKVVTRGFSDEQGVDISPKLKKLKTPELSFEEQSSGIRLRPDVEALSGETSLTLEQTQLGQVTSPDIAAPLSVAGTVGLTGPNIGIGISETDKVVGTSIAASTAASLSPSETIKFGLKGVAPSLKTKVVTRGFSDEQGVDISPKLKKLQTPELSFEEQSSGIRLRPDVEALSGETSLTLEQTQLGQVTSPDIAAPLSVAGTVGLTGPNIGIGISETDKVVGTSIAASTAASLSPSETIKFGLKGVAPSLKTKVVTRGFSDEQGVDISPKLKKLQTPELSLEEQSSGIRLRPDVEALSGETSLTLEQTQLGQVTSPDIAAPLSVAGTVGLTGPNIGIGISETDKVVGTSIAASTAASLSPSETIKFGLKGVAPSLKTKVVTRGFSDEQGVDISPKLKKLQTPELSFEEQSSGIRLRPDVEALSGETSLTLEQTQLGQVTSPDIAAPLSVADTVDLTGPNLGIGISETDKVVGTSIAASTAASLSPSETIKFGLKGVAPSLKTKVVTRGFSDEQGVDISPKLKKLHTPELSFEEQSSGIRLRPDVEAVSGETSLTLEQTQLGQVTSPDIAAPLSVADTVGLTGPNLRIGISETDKVVGTSIAASSAASLSPSETIKFGLKGVAPSLKTKVVTSGFSDEQGVDISPKLKKLHTPELSFEEQSSGIRLRPEVEGLSGETSLTLEQRQLGQVTSQDIAAPLSVAGTVGLTGPNIGIGISETDKVVGTSIAASTAASLSPSETIKFGLKGVAPSLKTKVVTRGFSDEQGVDISPKLKKLQTPELSFEEQSSGIRLRPEVEGLSGETSLTLEQTQLGHVTSQDIAAPLSVAGTVGLTGPNIGIGISETDKVVGTSIAASTAASLSPSETIKFGLKGVAPSLKTKVVTRGFSDEQGVDISPKLKKLQTPELSFEEQSSGIRLRPEVEGLSGETSLTLEQTQLGQVTSQDIAAPLSVAGTVGLTGPNIGIGISETDKVVGTSIAASTAASLSPSETIKFGLKGVAPSLKTKVVTRGFSDEQGVDISPKLKKLQTPELSFEEQSSGIRLRPEVEGLSGETSLTLEQTQLGQVTSQDIAAPLSVAGTVGLTGPNIGIGISETDKVVGTSIAASTAASLSPSETIKFGLKGVAPSLKTKVVTRGFSDEQGVDISPKLKKLQTPELSFEEQSSGIRLRPEVEGLSGETSLTLEQTQLGHVTSQDIAAPLSVAGTVGLTGPNIGIGISETDKVVGTSIAASTAASLSPSETIKFGLKGVAPSLKTKVVTRGFSDEQGVDISPKLKKLQTPELSFEEQSSGIRLRPEVEGLSGETSLTLEQTQLGQVTSQDIAAPLSVAGTVGLTGPNIGIGISETDKVVGTSIAASTAASLSPSETIKFGLKGVAPSLKTKVVTRGFSDEQGVDISPKLKKLQTPELSFEEQSSGIRLRPEVEGLSGETSLTLEQTQLGQVTSQDIAAPLSVAGTVGLTGPNIGIGISETDKVVGTSIAASTAASLSPSETIKFGLKGVAPSLKTKVVTRGFSDEQGVDISPKLKKLQTPELSFEEQSSGIRLRPEVEGLSGETSLTLEQRQLGQVTSQDIAAPLSVAGTVGLTGPNIGIGISETDKVVGTSIAASTAASLSPSETIKFGLKGVAPSLKTKVVTRGFSDEQGVDISPKLKTLQTPELSFEEQSSGIRLRPDVAALSGETSLTLEQRQLGQVTSQDIAAPLSVAGTVGLTGPNIGIGISETDKVVGTSIAASTAASLSPSETIKFGLKGVAPSLKTKVVTRGFSDEQGVDISPKLKTLQTPELSFEEQSSGIRLRPDVAALSGETSLTLEQRQLGQVTSQDIAAPLSVAGTVGLTGPNIGIGISETDKVVGTSIAASTAASLSPSETIKFALKGVAPSLKTKVVTRGFSDEQGVDISPKLKTLQTPELSFEEQSSGIRLRPDVAALSGETSLTLEQMQLGQVTSPDIAAPLSVAGTVGLTGPNIGIDISETDKIVGTSIAASTAASLSPSETIKFGLKGVAPSLKTKVVTRGFSDEQGVDISPKLKKLQTTELSFEEQSSGIRLRPDVEALSGETSLTLEHTQLGQVTSQDIAAPLSVAGTVGLTGPNIGIGISETDKVVGTSIAASTAASLSPSETIKFGLKGVAPSLKTKVVTRGFSDEQGVDISPKLKTLQTPELSFEEQSSGIRLRPDVEALSGETSLTLEQTQLGQVTSPDIAASLSVSSLTGPNIGIGISETDKVVGSSIAASTAASLSPSETINFGLKGVAPSLKTKVVTSGFSAEQGVDISPKLKKLQTPELSFEEQSSGIRLRPDVEALSGETSLTLEQTQLGQVTSPDIAASLSVSSLTGPNIGIGISETDKVVGSSIAASTAASLSPSETIKFGLKGVAPSLKTKVVTSGFSAEQGVDISPKLKKLQTPELSFEEQSSGIRLRPDVEALSGETSLTLEQTQLGQVTSPDIAASLSVAGTVGLTGPNIGIGISETDKVVGTSIAASTAASLSPSETIKFGLQGVAPSLKTKVVTSGFSAEQGVDISPKLKKLQTPELSFEEQSSGIRLRPEVEGLSGETSLTLEQTQLGQVTSPDIAASLSVSSLTGPNIGIGISETDKVVGSSIAASTAASLSPSETIKFGLKGVAPSLKTKVVTSGFSAEQGVDISPKLKKLQTPELSFEEQSSMIRLRPDVEALSGETSLTLKQTQLGQVTSVDIAAPLSVAGTVGLTGPNIEIGISETDKVVGTSIAASTAASLSPSETIKFGLKGVAPSLKTKVVTRGFSDEQGVDISPKLKTLQTPELSFEEQSSGIRLRPDVEALSGETSLTLEQTQLGQVTSVDIAAPLSVAGTVGLTGPNIEIGISETDKVVGTSIAASTAASLSPSETIKFGLKGVAPALKTKVVTRGFSDEQGVDISPKLKTLQTPELSFEEQSSGIRLRPDVEALSGETSLTLEQTQLGQVTSPDIAAPLSVSSLTGPNIGIGISETEKVVGTSIAASIAASLSSSETIKFGLKGVAPSLKTKVVSIGFSDEQGVDISPKLKTLQTPELSFKEQSSGIRLRPDVEALSGETSLTLEQTQLGQVTSQDIAAPLSVAGTVGLTGPNIGIGISETDKVVGTSIAASTAASLSPSETIKFGLKGVTPSLKTKVVTRGFSDEQGVDISPKLKTLQTPELSFEEQSSGIRLRPDVEALSGETSLTLEQTQLGQVTSVDIAAPLSVAGTVGLTGPNIEIGISETDKVVGTSIAASTAASLSPSETIKFGLQGVAPSLKTKVVTRGFSDEQGVDISPKLKTLQTPELSFEEQSSGISLRPDVEALSGETSLTLEQTQLGQVTSPDIGAPLSVSSLTGPNIGIGISETDKVVGTSIAASTAASLSPSETIKFGLKGVTPSLKTMVVTRGFSDEQGVDISPKLKTLQTPELSFEEQSSGISLRPDVEALSVETSLTLEQTQLGQVTSQDIAAPLSVAGTVGLTGPNIGIGISETDKVVGTSIAASTAASLSHSETIKFGLKGVTPSLKTKVVTRGFSDEQGVDISPKLKTLQTPELSFEEQSSGISLRPDVEALSGETSLTLEQTQLGQVTSQDSAAPLSVAGTVGLTGPNIGIGISETDKVVGTSIAASTAASLSPSETIKFGLKGVAPSLKTKVVTRGFSDEEGVDISPKLKTLQTLELSFEEQSSGIRLRPDVEALCGETSLTLEQTQLGQVTSPDIAAPLSVSSLTGPNIGIGISETDKVVGTSIAASTAASLSPSETIKFGLKGVAPSLKTKVVTRGFSDEQGVDISPKLKTLQTLELSFEEQSSGIRLRPDVEALSGETSLTLEQTQLGQVTSPDIAAPLSVSSLTGPNIGIGINETDKVVGTSIAASTAASLSPSETIKFGLKGVAPSLKTKVVTRGFSDEQGVDISPKLKTLQTPELSFEEQSSGIRLRPDVEALSGETSLTLEQTQLGQVTSPDIAAPLSVSSLTGPNIGIGINETDKVVGTSIAASTAASLSPSETIKFGLKGVAPSLKTKVVTRGFSDEQGVDISPKLKTLQTPELSFEEQSSGIRLRPDVEALSGETSLTLEQTQLGQVTSPDIAAPLSVSSLTGPNIGIGINETDKVVGTSIAASTAASLSPSETIKFGLKGVAPSLKTKVVTRGFSDEQGVDISPKLKTLQTPELSFEEQSSGIRLRPDVEALSGETSLTLEQTQLGQVTSPDIAAPLSVSSLTGPNIGIGINETDKVVGTSIAASTAASLSPSETIKFGLKGVAPSLKTKVVTRGFSDEQGVDISPKLKTLQTPELSFEEQSSGIRLRPDVEALSGETSLTLEQTQLGQVTSPDIAAPLSVSSLTGPNIGIGINETDKVVGTSIAASTAASLSPSETIKFGLKGVAPSLKTKVVTRGFSDEQGVDISPKLKTLQTPELSFEEQSSGIRLRPDVEALSGETSLTLEQTQLGQVTSPDIAAPLSVSSLTGPNIGIGISETDKVVGTSIAASTAASLSPSETIKFGLKGVAPSLKTKVVTRGFSDEQGVDLSPKLKTLQTPELSFEEQSSGIRLKPYVEALSGETSLTLEQTQLGQITSPDIAAPLSVSSLTGPNIGIGISETDKVVNSSIAASTAASLLPSETIKFGLKGVAPSLKTKVVTSGLSAEQGVDISPKLKKLQTPEMSFEEQSSGIRLRPEVEGLSGETSLTLEQSQLGQVTSPDIAAPLSVAGTVGLTGPNIGIGISETDKVVGTSIAASTAASLSPSETIKFGLKGVAPSLKTKVVTSGFSAEQGVNISPKLKKLQTPELSFEEQSSGIRLRPEVEGLLGETSLTLEQQQLPANTNTSSASSRVAKETSSSTSSPSQRVLHATSSKASFMMSNPSEFTSGIPEIKTLSGATTRNITSHLRGSTEEQDREDFSVGGGYGSSRRLVTFPDTATPVLVTRTVSLKSPNLMVGINETNNVATTTITDSPTETERVTSASKTKMVTSGFSAEQAMAISPGQKKLETSELSYQEQSSAMQSRQEMEGKSEEKSPTQKEEKYVLARQLSSTEKTPLISGEDAPNYTFLTSPIRRYRKEAQKIKCCIIISVLAIIVLAVVIMVSFALNHNTENDTNSTALTNSPMALSLPLSDFSNYKWPDPLPGDSEVEAAIIFGQSQLQKKDDIEDQIPRLLIDSPSYRHYAATKPSTRAVELSRSGYVLNVATRILFNGTIRGGAVGIGPVIHADGLDESICPDESEACIPSSFRQPDGSCNNLKHPYKWGVAFRPFRRSLPPDYGDGIFAPRLASNGTHLPSAREISITAHRPEYHDDSEFTLMLAVWGEFINHDMTNTAVGVAKEGKPFSCCTEQTDPHPECFPIALSEEDPYYHHWNITCMEFIRSAPAPTCYLGPREQLNQATSYIDGSVIYGVLDSVTSDLRSYKGGELLMFVTEDGRKLLPMEIDPVSGCNKKEEMEHGRYCFSSGDVRSNENLHLVTMHLIWARQHNKIAKQLSNMNPSWSDERLFQESKKIVSAQLQHITYNEMLPILFGEKLMTQLDLSPKQRGYFTGYNGSVDASIANQFASASFRFGHTLLPGLIKFIGNDNSSDEYAELHNMLFDPFRLYDAGSLDKTLQGSFMTHTSKFNTHFSREVTERLFMRGSAPCGLDLVSLNIQRGREHGLPGYPAWRKLCGFPIPKDFNDLNEVMDPQSVINLSNLYKSVEDIDLYTGALSEYPIEGGLVGPTITCLLADQFLRLKIGDRFWYETPEQPQAFTPDQLNEIRKTSLAGIICGNADSLKLSQPYVMKIIDSTNQRVPCIDIPQPDLSFWKDNL